MLHDVNDWIVRSPPNTPVISETALRSRQKKRILEDQVKKWRNSSSSNPTKDGDTANCSSPCNKTKRRNRRRRHSIGSHITDHDDGPPPLMDCDEDDAERHNEQDSKAMGGGSQRIANSKVVKTKKGTGSKDTENNEAIENSNWIPRSLGKRQHRRASTGHYPESSSDGFELVEPSLFPSTGQSVFRLRNDSKPHTQQKQGDTGNSDEQTFEKTNESFDNTWDDWPELSVKSDMSSTANMPESSSRPESNSTISITPGGSCNEFGSSPSSGLIASLSSKGTNPNTGGKNVMNGQFESNFFAVSGRRASMGSIDSNNQAERPARTPRRGSLGTIDGGPFLSPPRPPSLGTRLGAMGAGGYSPTGQTSPKNAARRPSFGSGSVTSARTGYSTNSGCDASRSSVGSSRASVSSSEVGRVILTRGVVRESSRSSLGSKGIQSLSDASRGSSIGSVRTGVSEGTVKSGVSLSSSGRKSVSSFNSTSSPKSVLIREGSRLKKALTLESIRSSVREAYRAPVSPASAQARMGNKRHPKDDHNIRQRPSTGVVLTDGSRESGFETSMLHGASNIPGSRLLSPDVNSSNEECSTGELNLPISPRARRRQRARSKGELVVDGERRGVGSTDGGTDSGDLLGRGYQSRELTEDSAMESDRHQHNILSPKKSRRKGQQRSDKRYRRGSLDALVGSLSPRLSRHKARSNRENKSPVDDYVVGSPRASRRKDSRRHSRDGYSNTRDAASDHKERRSTSTGYKTRRRNSLETNPVRDIRRESHTQEEPLKRRFIRRASTGDR